MRRAKGNEHLDFLEAIKRDQAMGSGSTPRGNAHIARSLYSSQIERVFRFFPREQVLIIKYEDFRANNSATLDRIFDFLGVRGLRGLKSKERNVGPYQRKMTPEEREYVSQLFEQDISKVEELLRWDCSDWRIQPKSKAAATS
jgi:hypothetical protein